MIYSTYQKRNNNSKSRLTIYLCFKSMKMSSCLKCDMLLLFKVVLSKLPIGDVATQYFADRDLFCAGRVQEEDLKRTMMVDIWILKLGCVH